MDKLFKALNDPTRRRILELLQKKDLTAGEIADAFETSKPTISHHLDLLRQADLILSEKDGQFITYSLNTTVLDECLAWLMALAKQKKKGKSETEKSAKRVASTADLPRAVKRTARRGFVDLFEISVFWCGYISIYCASRPLSIAEATVFIPTPVQSLSRSLTPCKGTAASCVIQSRQLKTASCFLVKVMEMSSGGISV